MSLPTARQTPDDTAPSQRSGQAVVSQSVPAGSAAADPMIGRVLDGRFTIVSRLGAGSMGTVYRAKQHAMGRDVAIKILRSDRALDDAARARFLREARANSLLASPHTVTVFDFGQADNGDFFLAMELLEGESVGQRIQRIKRVPVDQAVDTARQALRSLAEAHAKGIIHRDLKPDNLFYAKVLTAAGQHEEIVKVLDFGIAKMLTGENQAMNAVETQAGTVFGTPRYMSPEQAQGKPLDARSDLYSLGVILYHMLTGRPPFTDDDAIVVMARHIKTAPKSPSEACPQAHIPPEVEAALLRILAKDPAQRPGTAEQMSQELARAMSLSATATSGVRISLSGVTIPPVSSRPNGVMAATAVPQALGSAAGLPSAPLSGPNVAAQAPMLTYDTAELAAAAGIPSRRRKRAIFFGSVIGLLLLGGILVGVRTTASPTRRPAPIVTVTMSTATNAATTPTAVATAAPSAATPPAASAAPPPSSAAPASPPPPRTPVANVNDLPRASSKPAPQPPSRPAARPPPPAPRPPQAPPATTGSGHYGLFE